MALVAYTSLRISGGTGEKDDAIIVRLEARFYIMKYMAELHRPSRIVLKIRRSRCPHHVVTF
jgi:hypothetical protein